MQIQDRVTQTEITTCSLENAVTSSQNHLLGIQYPDGYWWAELESNVTITSEVVLLHKIWGTDQDRPLHKAETYLRSMQKEHGGWELFYGDGGEISTSVEAYMALRLLGVSASDPVLLKAKEFILKRGGISKTRIFTKFHLALIGCYDWIGIPSIPPWIMLFPNNFPFTIYDMSSWARGSTVPLLIVFDKKPIYLTDPAINLDELYAEGKENVKYELPRNNNWGDIFLTLDKIFKWTEKNHLVPFHQKSLKVAEKWILERQEDSGDWGGIIPAMLNSLLALRSLNYDLYDPIVQRGIKAVDNFSIETEQTYRVQACVSPVWDTAWCLRALVESGLNPDHTDLVRGAQWLLDRQILDYGDWQIKNKEGQPGGWAFEFENRFYPDLDDSAVVVMALHGVMMPNEKIKHGAIKRCLQWMATMQCKTGGWAAFDKDNDQAWLNEVPYGDLKAMIDPSTADVTARVLEMLGACGLSIDAVRVQKAIAFLEKEQETDGSWFGRWGVNYLYGTSGVLSALAVIAPDTHKNQMEKAVNWILEKQNPDGGWGETCQTYREPTLRGTGVSTASQTAWALIGLLDAGMATQTWAKTAISKGINYLISTQNIDGTWDEDEFTGTGFPCHFFIRYHMYYQYFPLIALGRYQKLKQQF
ncbi:squalene--hopene cyclase [Aphanothece hegewaldii CCALA 016]|uniref:Squalene--hopene cyclase n=1 Tax=Aphanothece hegewaldii CCALA 016 TaxID=2107694 RepID=A0A2T1LU97_9CHRO|nr:squalene--hopene cyclase [Aphanothece hegewaldii]PSF35034.1 squalene--hopene cyclase [Aphanothece hegewaldii CCALA 016]